MPRLAKLAISIARKMNALIFLVPEDIVDVRPRLVSITAVYHLIQANYSQFPLADLNLRWELDEHRSINRYLLPFTYLPSLTASGTDSSRMNYQLL